MRYENTLLIYSIATILIILGVALTYSERESFLFLGSLSNLIIVSVSIKRRIKRAYIPFALLTAVTILLITLIII